MSLKNCLTVDLSHTYTFNILLGGIFITRAKKSVMVIFPKLPPNPVITAIATKKKTLIISKSDHVVAFNSVFPTLNKVLPVQENEAV